MSAAPQKGVGDARRGLKRGPQGRGGGAPLPFTKAGRPPPSSSTGACAMVRTVRRATSLATRWALLLSVRLRSAPEHCPQDADEEQRGDWPMEPDPVQAGENIDQKQKTRNGQGHRKGPRQV